MSKFMNPALQSLEAYTPGEQPRDMQYIKLNTNENPYPPAPSVIKAVTAEEVSRLRLYSDPTCKGLKDKLAELYGVKNENVFVCNGSDEALNFAFMAFGSGGVVFPEISYGFYPVFGDLYGGNYEKIPLREDFTLDYVNYCGVGKMVVIANPNAPTGLSIPVAQIGEILKTNPDHVVLIDEAYVDFGGESALPLLEAYDNLLVVRTFSKSRCLAGGRLGYAFGSPEVIADLEKIRYSTNPYNLDRLALLLGEATVDAQPYYLQQMEKIKATRAWTKKELEKLGFTVLPSDANFLFAKTDKMDGGELYQKLKDRGVLVRHFTNPKICRFNRITIGTDEEMERFIQIVKELLEQ